MRRARTSVALVLVCAALVGCSGSHTSDLQAFVNDALKGTKPRVEPLPEVQPVERFAYSAAKLPDPFEPFNLREHAHASSGPRPDIHRKQPLEAYPLDSLKMVGTLSQGEERWAVIQAPDGTVYKVKVGNYMGQNYGKIVRISEDKVYLVELVQNPLGEWIARKASIAMAN